jgi:hypothetical protein
LSDININFVQLLNGETLPDGDVIQATATPALIDPSKVGIALKLSGVTWWKGIQSGPIVLCQCQDSQNYASTELALTDFQVKGLQLWKAKLFGVHTEMYNVSDAGTAIEGGHSYLFTWMHD